ncbi:MAG: 2-C-methyl-D-erythritol 4-phosphate cytidylyltransferase [Calditrichaeota bacterium]|nr:2-C-methyl-D-erythritol 4-phosphate cytidylyltransferase [Calditrichota bacterium]MCB9391119.1 2-C-methyl-D-erythritol 4-phosphate cytidylyltransferase [Calditrichota bacterium]
MTYSLLIPAAGRGERLGTNESKVLLDLCGRPLIHWTLDAFLDDDRLRQIVLATSPEDELGLRSAVASHALAHKTIVVLGGATRQDSVGLALDACDAESAYVLVHDAARPFVQMATVNFVLAGLRDSVACVSGVPVVDTIKRVRESRIVETLTRNELFAVQTPQGIRAAEFREAHSLARASGVQCTDDVALIEHFRLGGVQLVPGDPENLKITHPQDVPRALARLRDLRPL